MTSFVSILIYLFLLFLVGYMCRPALLGLVRSKEGPRIMGIFGVVLLVLSALVYWYLIKQEFVAFWDVRGAWNCALYSTNTLMALPVHEAIWQVGASINAEEYTNLSCFLVAPWLRLFGAEYHKFVLVPYFQFVVPGSFLFLALIHQVATAWGRASVLGVVVAAAAFAAGPVLMLPLVNNPSDVSGVPWVVGLAAVAYNRGFERFNWRLVGAVAVSLLLIVFLKRWYLFSVASFLGAYGLLTLLDVVTAGGLKNGRWKLLLPAVYQLLASAAFFVFISGVFLPRFFLRTFKNDYSKTYVGHKYGDFWHEVMSLYLHFGAFLIVLIIIGLAVALRRGVLRNYAAFTLLQTVTAFVALFQIQSFDWHHFLVIYIPLSVLMGVAIMQLRQWSVALPCVVSLLVVWNGVQVFTRHYTETAKYLLSAVHREPQYRPDMAALRSALAYFNSLSPDGKPNVYFLSSSPLYNESTFHSLNLPLLDASAPALFPEWAHTSVDRKHRISPALYLAEYVVVGDPIQLHLGVEHQRLVIWPAEQILSGQGIGRAYERIKSIPMPTGVTFQVYRKKTGIGRAEIEMLLADYRQAYPDSPGMYELANWVPAAFNVGAGGAYGFKTEYDSFENLYLPLTGANVATVSFHVANYQSISFTPVIENIAGESLQVHLRLVLVAGQLLDTAIAPEKAPAPIVVPLRNADEIHVTALRQPRGQSALSLQKIDLR